MYKEWLQYYGKDVSELQTPERFETFKTNIKNVREHNMKGLSYTKGVNQYSDLTFEEFKEWYLMEEDEEIQCSATNDESVLASHGFNLHSEKLPTAVDWRDEGVVTSVKDQGRCGSCWTFSTTGTLESHYNIHVRGKEIDAIDLSEQQLVDCAGDFDNNGCSGGLPSNAYSYINYNGLEITPTYEYHAADEACHHKAALSKVGLAGPYNLTEFNEEEMAKTIAFIGPIALSYQVNGEFKDYRGGVFTSDNCGTRKDEVNHAVQAVGYGVDEETGMQFWTIKNSWGARWGDEGYFKMERGVNMCASAVCNSIPVGVHDYHETTF